MPAKKATSKKAASSKKSAAPAAPPRTTHTQVQTVLPDADVYYIDEAARQRAEKSK